MQYLVKNLTECPVFLFAKSGNPNCEALLDHLPHCPEAAGCY